MRTLKLVIDRFLAALLIFLMGASVANVLWQVFTRFVLQNPSTFTDELARYLLVWIGILGAAYVSGQRLHLAIDLLPNALKGRKRFAFSLFIEACVLVFAGAMVVGGVSLVQLSFALGQASAALGVPLGIVYAVVPLSGLLIGFYSLLFFIDFTRLIRNQPSHVLDTVTASDEPVLDLTERPS